jgi:GTP cyclohydrolase II
VKPTEAIQHLLQGGAVLYDHEASGSPRLYLLALPGIATPQALATLLEWGRQIQIFINIDAWPAGDGPSSDVHKHGKVISSDLSVEGLQALAGPLQNWNFRQSHGWDRIVVRSFPRGDVMVQGDPEALLLEALSQAQTPVPAIFLAELHPHLTGKVDFRGPVFAQAHQLGYLTKSHVIDSRIENPRLISHTGVVSRHLKMGDFKVHSFYSAVDRRYHWVFATENFGQSAETPLVRIESECLTGHVLGSLLCDCGRQMEMGLEKVIESGNGALVYLRQEGRGIGLVNKLKAYRLQQQEMLDTVDANLAIGLPEDARDYLIGALALKYFGVSKLRLLTNNPAKVKGLEKYGIEVVERVTHSIPPSIHNAKYLNTKKERMGHLF